MNERLRELRNTLHLTQHEFATAIGLTRSVISEMELGTAPILDRTLILISAKFNVNEKWLKTGEGTMFNIKDVKFDEFYSIYSELCEPLQKFLINTAKELIKTQSNLNI